MNLSGGILKRSRAAASDLEMLDLIRLFPRSSIRTLAEMSGRSRTATQNSARVLVMARWVDCGVEMHPVVNGRGREVFWPVMV